MWKLFISDYNIWKWETESRIEQIRSQTEFQAQQRLDQPYG